MIPPLFLSSLVSKQSKVKQSNAAFLDLCVCVSEVTNRLLSFFLSYIGGQTREKAGPRSEAVSYFGVAEHFDVSK